MPYDLERPVLEGLRGELAETRLVVRLEREPEHRGEIRGELGGAIAEEPLDVATEGHRTRISGSSARTPSHERTRSRNGQ